jgi:hypothetical protein
VINELELSFVQNAEDDLNELRNDKGKKVAFKAVIAITPHP